MAEEGHSGKPGWPFSFPVVYNNPMRVQDLLEMRIFSEDPEGEDDPWVFVETDPLYQFAYVVGDDGEPSRQQSVVSIKVPLHSWLDEEEDSILLRTMQEASLENVRRVTRFTDLASPFWAKCSRNLSALVIHPDNLDKFVHPPRVPIVASVEVPRNRILAVGPREMAGIYLVRGTSRGFVAKRKQGLLSILVFDPS